MVGALADVRGDHHAAGLGPSHLEVHDDGTGTTPTQRSGDLTGFRSPPQPALISDAAGTSTSAVVAGAVIGAQYGNDAKRAADCKREPQRRSPPSADGLRGLKRSRSACRPPASRRGISRRVRVLAAP